MKKKRTYWINKTRDLKIHSKYKKGARVKDLAKEYKVTSSRITQINHKCERYYKRLADWFDRNEAYISEQERRFHNEP